MKTYRGETSDLVTKALGRDDGDLIREALVRRKVEREARVVLLDDLARSLRVETRERRVSRAIRITREITPRSSSPLRVHTRDRARKRAARSSTLGFSPAHLLDRLRANATLRGGGDARSLVSRSITHPFASSARRRSRSSLARSLDAPSLRACERGRADVEPARSSPRAETPPRVTTHQPPLPLSIARAPDHPPEGSTRAAISRGSRPRSLSIAHTTTRPSATADGASVDPRAPADLRPRTLSKMIAASATRVVVNAANTSRTQRVPAKKPAAGAKVRTTRDARAMRSIDRYLERGLPLDRAFVRRGGGAASGTRGGDARHGWTLASRAFGAARRRARARAHARAVSRRAIEGRGPMEGLFGGS